MACFETLSNCGGKLKPKPTAPKNRNSGYSTNWTCTCSSSWLGAVANKTPIMADLNNKGTAMKKPEILAFVTVIGQTLLDHGATIIDCFHATVTPRRGKVWHLQTNKFRLDTICGELHITVYDGWIACRFQDVDLAKQNLPIGLQSILNPFSGKWNHHYLDGWTARDAAQNFQEAISRILPRNATIEGLPA